MRNTIVGLALIVVGVVALSLANPSFTDTDATDNHGKIGLKKLTADIDANFAILEGGAYNQSFKPTSGAGVVTVTGNETNDASVVLDADDGDDNADTWTIKSATADNNLDLINHTTVAAELTAAGSLAVLDGIDAIGAVDLDIGSADVTDVTVTTDGGTVVLDGSITASGVGAINGTGGLAIEGTPTGSAGYIQFDANGAGANTNVLFQLGATITITDDGAGGLVETNTSAAAEYGLAIRINGEKYFILLEKE